MSIFKILNFLEPAPFQERIQDPKKVDETYKYWRIRILYSLFLGYTFFYFTRKSLAVATPFLKENLNYSAEQIGILSSTLYITYAFSKFLSGVASDRSNPRYFMAFGLILTGVCNILFGLSNYLVLFALFWGLNGLFQGWGWPPITKQLTHWYSKNERGKWWSICAISHNVGGALIPGIATLAAQQLGWRYALFVPGVLCIFAGIFLINRMRDVPETLGLPPIEVYRNDYDMTSDVKNNGDAEDDSKKYAVRVLSKRKILFGEVLNNKYVWLLAIAYFYVYVIRTAVNDWTPLYFIETRGYSTWIANQSIACFEVGGLLGMLAAGFLTDKFFKGKRISFMILCALGTVFTVGAIHYVPIANLYLDYALVSIVGFLIFGPQMLVGMVAAEAVNKKAAGTANGFVSCWAYIGAAATGMPLGMIIDNSWDMYYLVLISSCIILTAILISVFIFLEKKQNKLAQTALVASEG